jgi:hypothetical protein
MFSKPNINIKEKDKFNLLPSDHLAVVIFPYVFQTKCHYVIIKGKEKGTCLFIFIQCNIRLLHTNDGLIQQPEHKYLIFEGKIEKTVAV